MTKSSLGLERVNFFIEPSVKKMLLWIAKRRGTTMSEIIRAACKDYAVKEARTELEDRDVMNQVVQ